ncbi:MAG: exosortase/archaeosortase family protein [Candidatus Zixiibacteriota bacterium]
METKPPGNINKILPLVAAAVLLIIYLPVIIDLVKDWGTDGNYSHGFLIPVISGYLLWRKRQELAALEVTSNRLGIFFILVGVFLFVAGNGASEYFTVRFSLVVTIFGMALYFFGNNIIRRTWFEILFLVFMIPIPYVLYYSATFPMQLLASKVTGTILNLIGMPAIRQGNMIHLPNQSLEVAEACSGMRSMMSLLALGAIYAYMTQKSLLAKIILFASTIPIAVCGNVFRVFVTGIIVYVSDANVTAEPLHSIMGASVFIVAFLLLFLFGVILKRIFEGKTAAGNPPPLNAAG